MNTLLDFLANTNSRISLGDRWLTVERYGLEYQFTVREQKYGQKKSRVIYQGMIEGDAVIMLQAEEE